MMELMISSQCNRIEVMHLNIGDGAGYPNRPFFIGNLFEDVSGDTQARGCGNKFCEPL